MSDGDVIERDEDLQNEIETGLDGSGRGLILSKTRLCWALNISGKTVESLIREGAPVISRAEGRNGWQINVGEFTRFMVSRAVINAGGNPDALSLEAAKRRDKSAQAELRELELAKERGQLVDVEDVRMTFRAVFATVRSRLLAVSTQLVGMSHKQQSDFKDAINEALSDLSGADDNSLLDYNANRDAQSDTGQSLAH